VFTHTLTDGFPLFWPANALAAAPDFECAEVQAEPKTKATSRQDSARSFRIDFPFRETETDAAYITDSLGRQMRESYPSIYVSAWYIRRAMDGAASTLLVELT
jgi:hypothetical protein